MIARDLIELNRRASYALWNVATPNMIPKGLSPRLIFPELRDGNIRISEQEARLLWCALLQDTSYYYSVEVPTVETYTQTGTKPQSALTDVALYRPTQTGFERIANVEFKAHNTSVEYIRKDIEKLIREKTTGNWFHLLKATNSTTIPRLFEKFVTSFLDCSSYVTQDIDIVFSICVIRKPRLLSRRFVYYKDESSFDDYVIKFFSDIYSWNTTMPDINNNNFQVAKNELQR